MEILREKKNIRKINFNFQNASKLAEFARTVYFDWIAFTVSVIYIITLAFDRYEIVENASNIINYIDYICAILFVVETALRLHSQRRAFLLNLWNFYDSITVILLFIGELMRRKKKDKRNTCFIKRVLPIYGN